MRSSTDGRGLVLEPHPASIQDRDGGEPLLRVSRRIFPFIRRVFADSGYAGQKVATATLIAVEIVRKNPDQIGFAVNPRRWVVERFFLTDAEWRVIAPHLPKPCATGRPREWPMREIINGIFYVMRAGCSWRLLPNDLPPWGTIYRWFAVWRDDGRFERINHALVMADRERVGRDASPSAAIIDSQSVKTTEAGGSPVTMLESTGGKTA
jgi:transposase